MTNIKDFLQKISEKELQEKGILRGKTKVLQGSSLEPLINLMKEYHVEKLEYPEIKWLLDVEYNFSNPYSYDLKKGNAKELSSPGLVFLKTNTAINPYYSGTTHLIKISDSADEEDDSNSTKESTMFAYEVDLQRYLVKNLSKIESGLSLFEDIENDTSGVEYSVDNKNKRIDILARDKTNTPVVIELKVERGYERAIGQSLYYRNRIKEIFNTDKVRIIIIGRDISERLKIAVQDLDDVQLFEYKLSVELTAISS